MRGFLYWCDREIPYRRGETLAYTLLRECGSGLGTSDTGQTYGLFCGIGACQGCLVRVDGHGVKEACLIMSDDNMRVQPVAGASDSDSDAEGQYDVD